MGRVHGLHDFLAAFGNIPEETVIIFVPIKGDAEQRQTVTVLVVRVKVEELVRVGQAFALNADAYHAVPIAAEIFFPFTSPLLPLSSEAARLMRQRREYLLRFGLLLRTSGSGRWRNRLPNRRANRVFFAAATGQGRAADE